MEEHTELIHGKLNIETGDDGEKLSVFPEGCLTGDTLPRFREVVDAFRAEHPERELVFHCDRLTFMDGEAAEELKKLSEDGAELRFTGLNQECYAALLFTGLERLAGSHTKIPAVDVSGLPVIGEGSNGIVYQLNDELIIKTFKKQPSYRDILQEQMLTRKAVQVGIPCPISFGFALVNGKPALLSEYLRSESFTKLVRKDRSAIREYMPAYVKLVKDLHSVKGGALEPFARNAAMRMLMRKANLLDDVIGTEYKGKLRETLEGIRLPEVLVHGDIQPSNIRFSSAGTSIIDLETLSTGPAVCDIGALWRTLHVDWYFDSSENSPFLGLPADVCREIWEAFTDLYWKDLLSEKMREEKRLAMLIGCILSGAKFVKRGTEPEKLAGCVKELQILLDQRGV